MVSVIEAQAVVIAAMSGVKKSRHRLRIIPRFRLGY